MAPITSIFGSRWCVGAGAGFEAEAARRGAGGRVFAGVRFATAAGPAFFCFAAGAAFLAVATFVAGAAFLVAGAAFFAVAAAFLGAGAVFLVAGVAFFRAGAFCFVARAPARVLVAGCLAIADPG